MDINVLEIYKDTSDLLSRFIVIEKVSHIGYLILFLFLLAISSSFLNWLNQKITNIKTEEEKKDSNLYKLYLLITFVFFVICFCGLCRHLYLLIECLYNPQYVYLKQLIALTK